AGNALVFLQDHVGYTKTEIDTVMSLNNSGGTLSLINQNGSVIHTLTYTSTDSGSGDGNSLQKNSGRYTAATPTPGRKPIAEQDEIEEEEDEEPQAATGEKKTKKEEPKPVPFASEIIGKATALSNVASVFTAQTTGIMKE